MDEEKKRNKSNWWHRLPKLRLQPSDSSPGDNNKAVVLAPSVDNGNYVQARSTFRRSIKRFHTRMKGCISRQKSAGMISDASAKSAVDVPPPVPHRPYARNNMIEPLRLSPVRMDERASALSTPLSIPTEEIHSLSMCYWYWGPMSTSQAEDRLKFKPDGTFLVRDSSSTSYLFTVSFRSVGRTMHARIEYDKGMYSLYGSYVEGFPSVTELIAHAIAKSEDGIFCYSNRDAHDCQFPVRLTRPMSRYTEVRTLKHLCKFVIRQCTNINDVHRLPLPNVLCGYLLEGPYF